MAVAGTSRFVVVNLFLETIVAFELAYVPASTRLDVLRIEINYPVAANVVVYIFLRLTPVELSISKV